MIDKSTNIITLSECMKFYSSRDIKIITLIAKKGLGEYYESMKEFYSEIFFDKDYDAIIFDDKTSINMAEIFLVILWNESDLSQREKLEKNWSKFMTYNAYLEKFGLTEDEYIKANNKTSKILVVDDMITHGNTQNELLNNIVNRRKLVLDQLYVKSFSQLKFRSLLRSSYHFKVKAKHEVEFEEYYDLMQRIFTVVSMAGKVNKSIVAPIEIPINDFDKIENDFRKPLGFQMTNISREEGNIFERFYYGYTHESMKYYLSIRAIKNCYTSKYRLIPFIFVPTLSSASYKKLKQKVFEKWGIVDLSISPQLEYDLVQTYLNQSLLFSVLRAADIRLNFEDYDMTKMAINFGLNQQNPKINIEYFKRLSNPSYLFSFEELKNTLHEATIDMPCLFKPEDNNDFYANIEDIVYGIRMQEQTEAFRRANTLPPLNDKTLVTNRKNNWNFTLLDFIKQLSKECKIPSIHELITSLLLLSDIGYINLSSKIFGDDGEREYSQILRANNYAVFILPKRYEIYNSVLAYMCNSPYEFKEENIEEELTFLLRKAKADGNINQDVDISILVRNLMKYYGIIKQSYQAFYNYWTKEHDGKVHPNDIGSSEYSESYYNDLRKKLELMRKKRALYYSCYSKDYK